MKRSNRRKFRRRRQTAGFVIFGCLAIVLLSGMVFLNSAPDQESAASRVQRVEMPDVANAPDAIDAGAIEEASRDAAEEEVAEEGGKEQASPDDEDAGKQESGDSGSKDEPEGSSSGAPEIPEPSTNDLYLTVPKMGLADNYVANTEDPIAMDNGAIKLPSTGFPWQNNANTYIAAHVLGYAGTGSYMQFAGLPSMTYGDVIYLSDANGTVYTYSVSEILTVYPQDNWVTDPIPGKNLITLQTCVNPPLYDQRLIVRAERVDVQTA